jgi:hypothetical protein
MIFDKFIHRVMNRTALTLDDPAYWHTGGTLFGGQAVQAMKLPAVNACIEIISDSLNQPSAILPKTGTASASI